MLRSDSMAASPPTPRRTSSTRAPPKLPVTVKIKTKTPLGIRMMSHHDPDISDATFGDVQLHTFQAPEVIEVKSGSVAEGYILLDDSVVIVNGNRCMGAQHASALIGRAIQDSGEVKLELLRPSPAGVQLEIVNAAGVAGNAGSGGDGNGAARGTPAQDASDELQPAVSTFVSSPQPFGLTVFGNEGDVRIVGLTPGGVALRSNRLSVGCRIIAVGGSAPCTSAAQVADAVAPGSGAAGGNDGGARGGGRTLALQVAHEPGEQPGPDAPALPRPEGALDL